MTYKTPIGMSSFRLILGKPCHLPVELEHRAYWAIMKLNLSLDEAGKYRLLQLQELQELRRDAYENAEIYKEKTKPFMNRTSEEKLLTSMKRFGYITLTLSFFQVSCAHDWTVLTWLWNCLTTDQCLFPTLNPANNLR